MRPLRLVGPLAALATQALVGGTSGCSASGGGALGNGDDGGVGSITVDGGPGAPCIHLQCQQQGDSTTVRGVVYDPAGRNPLYGVAVYVPNAPVQPFARGASCYKCDDLYSGDPVASALTGPDGGFVIKNAPVGANIPLVIQVGKWRTQVTIPTVVPGKDNTLPDKSLRLPKNHGEGDIPEIAISTGASDSLECLLSRIGVDHSEYAVGPSDGHIHIFRGNAGTADAPTTDPVAPSSASALWSSAADLMRYDMLLLSCEGQETAAMNQQALFDYAAGGGRVFASHFHYAWFDTGPFATSSLATWTTGSNTMGDISATVVTTLPNNQPFPKGAALQQWLMTVNALTDGRLPILEARHNADVATANTPSQAWIVADQSASLPGTTQYFSFDTPFGVPTENQCGRVVFSDLHVGAASADYVNLELPNVPDGCADIDLSPQEKALEFMLFDLSSCITPSDQSPKPPSPR